MWTNSQLNPAGVTALRPLPLPHITGHTVFPIRLSNSTVYTVLLAGQLSKFGCQLFDGSIYMLLAAVSRLIHDNKG